MTGVHTFFFMLVERKKERNSTLFDFFSLFGVRKIFLTVSDLFSLQEGGNNWLEKPILKCRAAEGCETFQKASRANYVLPSEGKKGHEQ